MAFVKVLDARGALHALEPQHNVVDGRVRQSVSFAQIEPAPKWRGSVQLLDQRVDALMTSNVRTCTGEDTVMSVMELMTDRRIRHVPVVEDGRLVGIVSIGDAVKNRLHELENEASQLREYINT